MKALFGAKPNIFVFFEILDHQNLSKKIRRLPKSKMLMLQEIR